MSSRAQIAFEDTGVYIYDHFGAEHSTKTLLAVRSALEHRHKWSDPEYLTAAVFQELYKTSTHLGIGTTLMKPKYLGLLVIISCRSQTVRIITPHGRRRRSFEDFVTMDFEKKSKVKKKAARHVSGRRSL